MTKFKVGDNVECRTAGKLYKAKVIKVEETGFIVVVYYPLVLNNLFYTYDESFVKWTLIKTMTVQDKVKTMWERQPYVKRLKQCSDKANSLSGMS